MSGRQMADNDLAAVRQWVESGTLGGTAEATVLTYIAQLVDHIDWQDEMMDKIEEWFEP